MRLSKGDFTHDHISNASSGVISAISGRFEICSARLERRGFQYIKRLYEDLLEAADAGYLSKLQEQISD